MSAIEAISVEPQQGLAVVGYTFLATCRLCGGSVAHEAINEGHAGTMVFTAKCSACEAVNAYRVEAFVVEQPKRKQVRAPRVWGRVIHTGRAVRVLDSDSEGFRVRFPGSKKVHWMGPDDVQILSDEEGAAA